MSALKHSTIALLACYLSPALALPLIPVGERQVDGRAAITHQLNTTGSTFLSSDTIALSFNLHIAAEDIGFQSALYLVAKTANQSYIRHSNNSWQVWDQEQLVPAQALTLSAEEYIEVLNNQRLAAGEYQVYAAYQARNGDVKYNKHPATLVVFAHEGHALHPIGDPAILRDYLYQGAFNSSYGGGYVDIGFPSGDFSGPLSIADTSTNTTLTSSTLLQETGVDEGDRIKTDGDLLFSLRACANDINQNCLHSDHLQDSPAQSTALGALQVSETDTENYFYASRALGELYLRAANETSPRTVIWLNNQENWQTIPSLYPDWVSYDHQTQLKFINADDPEQLSLISQLTIEGRLLSSRLVDGVLYLLSQKSNYYWGVYDNESNPAQPPLNFFLPHYQLDNAEAVTLLESDQCYIPPQSSSRYNQSTLSIITAIPVNNPAQLQSRCIAGELETFYASSNALYFATTRYPYTSNNNQLFYDYAQEQITEIHKFSLQTANMEYRGSGQVTGHLGWDQEKKSFRFGEYNNTLRVATSEGSSWSMDSRTKVTVLAEDTPNHALEEISAIANLGKPGERLYAARFIGDRGYLVTFRVTDPLIVIDFSIPEAPEILGELEINGYSDYLQPIGDHYLLGIGKDAIADDNAPEDDVSRGAWYQGVKISLFDVSGAENLSEVSSIIIGKRGTDSTVLHDHHGLSLLTLDEQHYKIALPIELHDYFNAPGIGTFFNPLSAYYNWTHTGLYVFDINLENNAGIQLDGKLITESASFIDFENTYPYDFLNDRSVLHNQSVHYIHGNRVISSEIANLE